MNFEPHQAFQLSSPMLRERGDTVLRECPTGYVLRNAPYVYRAINAQNHAEAGALNPMDLSCWARDAMSVVASERARLMDAEREHKRQQADAAHANAVLRSARG